jgi:hypothetical protein
MTEEVAYSSKSNCTSLSPQNVHVPEYKVNGICYYQLKDAVNASKIAKSEVNYSQVSGSKKKGYLIP